MKSSVFIVLLHVDFVKWRGLWWHQMEIYGMAGVILQKHESWCARLLKNITFYYRQHRFQLGRINSASEASLCIHFLWAFELLSGTRGKQHVSTYPTIHVLLLPLNGLFCIRFDRKKNNNISRRKQQRPWESFFIWKRKLAPTLSHCKTGICCESRSNDLDKKMNKFVCLNLLRLASINNHST